MRERLVWVDAARTLACGLVVLVHVNIYARAGLETWWPLGFWGVPFFAIAVPAFLVLSGYLAAGAREEGAAGAQPGGWSRLLVPFFFWNVATSLALAAEGQPLAAGTTVLRLLTGTWQLYFIFALLQLRLFHTLTRERAGEGRVLAAAAAATAATWAIGDILLWRLQGADGGVFELVVERLFPCWLLFFVAGTWLRRHPELFESLATKWLAPLLAALAVSWGLFVLELRLEEHRFGYNPRKQILLGGLPCQLLSAVLALSLLRALDRPGAVGRALARLAAAGRDTFGIYLSHTVVLIGVFAAARTSGFDVASGWQVPLLAAATWVPARAFVRLVRAVAPAWLAFLVLGERKEGAAPVSAARS